MHAVSCYSHILKQRDDNSESNHGTSNLCNIDEACRIGRAVKPSLSSGDASGALLCEACSLGSKDAEAVEGRIGCVCIDIGEKTASYIYFAVYSYKVGIRRKDVTAVQQGLLWTISKESEVDFQDDQESVRRKIQIVRKTL